MKLGLVVRLWGPQRAGRSDRYEDVRYLALHAEASGFDSIWLEDHLLYRDPDGLTFGIWECWTCLAALAEATERVQLGTLMTCTQFRSPGILAKMATTLDEISNGRFVLGLGAGWDRSEFDTFGIPFDHRADRFEEALQIILPLLRNRAVDFQGRYYRASSCELIPRGPTRGGPPILIAAAQPRMLRLAAQYADCWDIGSFLTQLSAAAEQVAAMRDACREVGRDPSTLQMTAGISVAYPELEPVPAHWGAYLTGTSEMVDMLRGLENLGVSHATFWLFPNTVEAASRLLAAVNVYGSR